MVDYNDFKNIIYSQDNCIFPFEFINSPFYNEFENNFEEDNINESKAPFSEKKTDCDDEQNYNNIIIKSKELKSSSENINQEMEIENEIYIVSPNNTNPITQIESNNENPIT